jgi:hypothetical protein
MEKITMDIKLVKLNDEIIAEDIINKLTRHKEKKWKQRDLSKIKQVVFHHAANNISAYDIAKYHVGPNHISKTGCPGICYHFYIEKDGSILLCNKLEDIVWGTKGVNTETINICINGNLDIKNPTLNQIKSVIKIWEWSKILFKLNNKNCHKHSDFTNTKCPGEVISGIVKSIQETIS